MTSIHEQDKRKGGRPPTGRVRKLSKSVTVKFSKPSYEALRLRARKANRKLAEYIRESALNGEVVSGHNAETVAIAKNLIGMANNLNQLTKLSHQRGFHETHCNGLVEEVESHPLRVQASIPNLEIKHRQEGYNDMIGKLKKGCSFGGCIRYVTGKDEAKILASDGVLLGTNTEMAQSFELQRQLNPKIKKPVGHIALSFKPEDKPRLTDELMAKIALEYMQMMGITDTQFIIVRHHNTDNPHCHIVYNRINNEGKLISDRNDYRRNEQVTKALKSKYGFTYGTDKSNTNTRKLRNAERAKYEIHNAIKDALKVADNWQKFKSELEKRGVHLELVYKDKERTKVQGIRFCKDGYSFKGTQISRDYSFGKLNARLEGTENLLSASANSAQQYEQGCCKNEQEPSISESSQDPWDGISSIGLFAPANAQTFEPFPEDESVKKKKKKRRRGFSL